MGAQARQPAQEKVRAPMPKSKQNELAENIPRWLKNWANDCATVAKNDLHADDLRFHPAHEIEAFRRVLGDSGVVADLSALERPQGSAEDQERIKAFLSTACHILAHSKTLTIATPSRARKKLEALAKAADELAGRIHENEPLLWPATDLNYLSERATAPNPNGFMLAHRAGLRAGRYTERQELPSLVEVLEAFSADIKEELADFPKRLDGLDGGMEANIRWQMRWLNRVYQNLFGKPNAGAIARLLTALNDKDIKSDRIRKAKIRKPQS